MSPKEIMKIPWIQFIIGMLDAPHIDYGEKKKNGKVKSDEEFKPKTQSQEIAAVIAALK